MDDEICGNIDDERVIKAVQITVPKGAGGREAQRLDIFGIYGNIDGEIIYVFIKNLSTKLFLGNDEKQPCREIDTVEKIKTGEEGMNDIEVFTARHLKLTLTRKKNCIL